MNKIAFSLFVFLLHTLSYSAPVNKNQLCETLEPGIVASYDINQTSEYFFRPYPNSNKIGLAENQKNYIVDLDTKKAVLVPGKVDVTVSPDENFLVYPDNEHLRFVSMPGKNGKSAEFGVDLAMRGHYQSVAKLPAIANTSASNRYRVLIDRDGSGMVFQDYEVANDKMKILRKEPIAMCGNLSPSYSLPMISKDGQQVAFLDNKSQTTKIFKVDSQTGNCTLKLDLGISAGKIDFSYDGKSVAFHTISILRANDMGGGWLQKPLPGMVANAWVMDLGTGEAKQVTHFFNTSALYPAFNRKGELLIRKYREKGTTILKVDPTRVKNSDRLKGFQAPNLSCSKDDHTLLNLFALGSLVKKICMPGVSDGMSIPNTALLIANLDEKHCHQLATFWMSEKKVILSSAKESKHFVKEDLQLLTKISVRDLQAACTRAKSGL